MKFLTILFFVSTAQLLLYNCNTTEPPDPPPPVVQPTLTLILDDAHCTEAWLQLTTKDLQLPAELTLKQYNPTGDSLSQIFVLNTQDSLLYIDSLLPNQTYKFKAILTTTNNPPPTTNLQTVTTMDTTSHNFTFEMITFGGEIGSSVLYDVAIINENDIWAVGYIYVSDTSQTGYETYNAAHWNGTIWELLKIPHYDYGGYLIYGPLQTVLAFSENDIWFCSPANLVHFDGNTYNSKAFFMTDINFNGQVQKMWGTDKNNIYCVGRNGAIYNYNGTSWQRIESGTTLNINDIWGDFNPKTGEWEILAGASNKFLNEGSAVMKIEGAISLEINRNGLPWSLSSVWFKANKKYYIGGDGLFFNKIVNDNWWKDTTFIPIYKDRVRGLNINDIVISGSNGLFSHFNGISWKHYINNELPYYSGRLLSVDIKNTTTVAVGWKESQAIVTMGKR